MHQRDQGFAALGAFCITSIIRVAQRWLIQFTRENFPLAFGHHADENLFFIGRVENIINAPGAPPSRHGVRRLAGDGLLQHGGGDQKRRVFKQPRLQTLPAPTGFTLAERSKDRNHAEHAAHHVIHRRPSTQRPPWRAGHVSQPRLHLHHFIQRSAIFIRTRQITLERAIDQPRIARGKRFIAQALRGQAAGAEILYHHIGRINQALQQFQILGILRIQCHAFLVAAEGGKEARARSHKIARAIPLAGRFDLDHLSAQISQDQAASGPHDHVGEFDNANAGKRKRMHQKNLRAALEMAVRPPEGAALPEA